MRAAFGVYLCGNCTVFAFKLWGETIEFARGTHAAVAVAVPATDPTDAGMKGVLVAARAGAIGKVTLTEITAGVQMIENNTVVITGGVAIMTIHIRTETDCQRSHDAHQALLRRLSFWNLLPLGAFKGLV